MKLKSVVFFITCIFFGFLVQSQTLSTNNDIALRYEHYENPANTHLSVRTFDKRFQLADSCANKLTSGYRSLDANLFEQKYENGHLILNPVLFAGISYTSIYTKKISPVLLGGVSTHTVYKKFEMNALAFYGIADDKTLLPQMGYNSINAYPLLFNFHYRPSELFDFEIGRSKTFFGHGYRSILLSENAPPYPYFRTTVDVWRFKYVWQIGKMSDYTITGTPAPYGIYDKYAFWHYLSFDITKRLNFNFFEVIVTNPYGHNLEKQGLNLAYFNPIVFYRPVEFAEGTMDNALLGVGLNIRIFKSASLYSQFLLDDMIIGHLTDGSGWWANKFGIQAGIKAHNTLNIKGLNFLGELNIVRPYTYAHGEMTFATMPSYRNMNLNYTYQGALAHPLGANFAEALTHISYMYKRLVFSTTLSYFTKGYDTNLSTNTPSFSMGGNIYKSYHMRPDDFGITFLQGIRNEAFTYEVKLNYILNPKWLLEAEIGAKSTFMTDEFTSYQYIFAGIRSQIF